MDIGETLAWIEKIYGPLSGTDGVPPDDLDEAAARLGVALPDALREFYARAGRSGILNGRVHELLLPERLYFEGSHLIFCHARRGDARWGIDRGALTQGDPPVELAFRSSGQNWRFAPQFATVSLGVRSMVAWEAVEGGLPFVGVVKVTGTEIEFREPLPTAMGVALPAMRAWLVPAGVVVCVDDEVYLAARTAEAFRQASAVIGIDEQRWDYATILDEVDVD